MPKFTSKGAIVHAVIGLARSLDLRVVAEGVEDHESLSRLAHLHCDVAQGYLLGRPAPIEELPQAALGNIRPDWPPFV